VQKQNILIIDDEPAITQSLRRSLRENFDVFTANTVSQALEILKLHEIAVIITDQRMPDMQGVDFLQLARQVQPYSLSILLSGYSDVQALVAALNISTVRGFIPKPWDNQVLLEKIKSAAKEYQAVIQNPLLLQSTTAAVAELQQQVDDLKHLVDVLTLGPENKPVTAQAASEPADKADHETQAIQNLYAPNTGVTNRITGLFLLRETHPEKFQELENQYMICLDQAFEQKVYKIKYQISNTLQNMANELGILGAGPRDVIEIHNFAIRTLFEKYTLPRRQVYLEEGRLTVLELMGDLAMYYRSIYFKQSRDAENRI
jgi:response regulator RpfG family c-di-GMP phosphodiesterase